MFLFILCFNFFFNFDFSNYTDHSIEFVDWLHRLCTENLVPGSNFQRRKMCLEILNVIYEVFVLPDLSYKRKSFVGMNNFHFTV